MKGFVKSLVAAALLLAPGAASAQVYGQWASAEVVPVGGHLFGGYLHASEDMLGLMAQLRLSFYPNVDFGFHGGLTRLDTGTTDRTTVRIGGDFKVLVYQSDAFHLSAGGALGVETGDRLSVLTLGPTLVASHSFAMGAGGGITPYGGVGLLFSNIDVAGNQTTDFSLPFRFGAEFAISPEIRIVGELQMRASDEFNDDIGFVTGVNLPF